MSERFIPDKTNHWLHVSSRRHALYNYAHTRVTCVARLVTDTTAKRAGLLALNTFKQKEPWRYQNSHGATCKKISSSHPS